MKPFPLLALPQKFRPDELPCELKTRFGYVCTLRALQRRDAPRLFAFFQSHSDETRRQRYGYRRSDLTDEKADALVSVDERRQALLGILEGKGAAARIVAVGRFTLGDDPRSAEVAFVVHEDRRRTGMATVLLEALTAIARERGVERFTAQTLSDNFGMLSIFLKHGARVRPIEGTDGIDVDVPLEPHRPSGKSRR